VTNYVVNLSSGSRRPAVFGSWRPDGKAVFTETHRDAPDGNWWYTLGVWSVGTAPESTQELGIERPKDVFRSYWAHDGKYLAFATSTREGTYKPELQVINTRTKQRRTIMPCDPHARLYWLSQ